MSWLPAITVLLLVNAAELVAIALAPLMRAHGRRGSKRHAHVRMGDQGLEVGSWKLGIDQRRPRVVSERTDEQTLLRALSDADPNIRLTAARLVGERRIGDDVALVEVLTTVDEAAGRLLVGSRPAQHGPPPSELLAIAARADERGRVAAIRLLGAYVDSRSRRALAALLADADARIRGEAASALAASTRLGYPNPLEPAIVNRLIEMLGGERSQTVIVEVVDALTYSLDRQVPAALMRLIPSSNGAVRERLIEAGAVFAQLVQSGTRAVEGARP